MANTLGRSLKYLHESFKDRKGESEKKDFIEFVSWVIEFGRFINFRGSWQSECDSLSA